MRKRVKQERLCAQLTLSHPEALPLRVKLTGVRQPVK